MTVHALVVSALLAVAGCAEPEPECGSTCADGSLAAGDDDEADQTLVRDGACPRPHRFAPGTFAPIYDPSAGKDGPWYINDHTFIRDRAGTWHLFGITRAEPASPFEEVTFAHATARSLAGPWSKHPPALVADPSAGETWLWAPHVIESSGTYYMFYQGGCSAGAQCRIRLATSPDLWTWTRRPEPLFTDGHARDPYVLRVGGEWILYYTATREPSGGPHAVAFRRSADLLEWGAREIAFEDPGSIPDSVTESPFVLPLDGSYYLFIGPRDGSSFEYVGTDVYRSDDPLRFSVADRVGHIASHAAEVIAEGGAFRVSHAGWGQGGVWLADLAIERPQCKMVDTPAYRAIVETSPRASLASLAFEPPGGGAPRELLLGAHRSTAPYLAVGDFGVTDGPGAARSIDVAGARGDQLLLAGIPMGDEPVTADWRLRFADDAVDLELWWQVDGPLSAPAREVAMNLATGLPSFADDGAPDRPPGDVTGFPRYVVASDGSMTLACAYRAGSAFGEANRWYWPEQGLVTWQALWSGDGAAWPPGSYPGGVWRLGASFRADDTELAQALHHDLNR